MNYTHVSYTLCLNVCMVSEDFILCCDICPPSGLVNFGLYHLVYPLVLHWVVVLLSWNLDYVIELYWTLNTSGTIGCWPYACLWDYSAWFYYYIYNGPVGNLTLHLFLDYSTGHCYWFGATSFFCGLVRVPCGHFRWGNGFIALPGSNCNVGFRLSPLVGTLE